MNAIRRLFLALYSLLLIAAAGALIALAWADNQQFNWSVGSWNFQAFIDGSNAAKTIFTIILGAIAFIGLLTLILAIYRDRVRGSRGALRMRQADGGTVEVTSRSIEALLRDELQRLPDVHRVDPKVRLAGGAVDTSLDATIAPTANIASVTSMLSQSVSTILRDQVGVTNVRRPSIRIMQDETAQYTQPQAYTPAREDIQGHTEAVRGNGGTYSSPASAPATRSDPAVPRSEFAPQRQPDAPLPPPPPLHDSPARDRDDTVATRTDSGTMPRSEFTSSERAESNEPLPPPPPLDDSSDDPHRPSW